ncbi:MAG TPA: NADH-quinone oxidoreductase subunit J [Vicinamibacteria bacterium]|nr:NADH-quinone oxidoreductase subunit J [Vicinamibacteria bacterium]
MDAPTVIFWLFAALMIGSAVVVVHGKNLVHSAFALLATFFSVAVFYALLGADFLAGAQVLIYVGGIVTLLVFGVMLTNRIYNVNLRTGTFQVLPAALVSLGVFVTLFLVVRRTPWREVSLIEEGPTTGRIGQSLMTDYVLAFEIASVLLLVALLGAAMLVRRRSDL